MSERPISLSPLKYVSWVTWSQFCATVNMVAHSDLMENNDVPGILAVTSSSEARMCSYKLIEMFWLCGPANYPRNLDLRLPDKTEDAQLSLNFPSGSRNIAGDALLLKTRCC